MKQSRSGKNKANAGGVKPVAAAGQQNPPTPHRPLFGAPARTLWPAALVILLAVFIFYLPALRGGFIWDDDDYLTNNMALRSLSGLWHLWFKFGTSHQYYPLVFTTFWLEYHLWGLAPLGYHLNNILLHAGSALLLWTALRRLRLRGAWVAGLLFAVHPVAVESVAWVTERKNVLSTFLYLLSFLAMIRFYHLDDDDAQRARAKRPWGFYALALLLFFAALLSKTVTCTLPGALVIVLWWKRDKLKIRDLLPLVPFFALGAAMGLLTAWMEKHFVIATGVDWLFTPLDRILLAGRVIWFYLAKLAFPFNLTFIYPRWKIDAHQGWQYLFPLGVAVAALALWLARRRIGKGPLAAMAFFVASLFPALGFFDVYPMRYSFVADHFQYLAMLGPLALAGALITLALDKLRPEQRPAGIAGLVILTLLLGALTWSEGTNYKDFETIWRVNYERNEHSFLAINNLGVLLANHGQKDKAIQFFERAVAESPSFDYAHANLAGLLSELNRNAEAETHYREALRLNPADKSTPCNFGILLTKLNRLDEAVAMFHKSIAIDANNPLAYFNLGNALAQGRRYGEAIESYRTAWQQLPGNPQVAERLAWLLASAPEDALRRGPEAVNLAEGCCRATAGRDPASYRTLALAYAEVGHFDDATQAAQKAIALAQAAGKADLAETARTQLQSFQARRPYREPAAVPGR